MCRTLRSPDLSPTAGRPGPSDWPRLGHQLGRRRLSLQERSVDRQPAIPSSASTPASSPPEGAGTSGLRQALDVATVKTEVVGQIRSRLIPIAVVEQPERQPPATRRPWPGRSRSRLAPRTPAARSTRTRSGASGSTPRRPKRDDGDPEHAEVARTVQQTRQSPQPTNARMNASSTI